MPQPLLASCAGALRAHGHDVSIVDDGTVDALGSAICEEMPSVLASMLDTSRTRRSRWTRIFSAAQRRGSHVLHACQRRRVERALAESVVDGPAPDVAVIFVQRHKDLALLRRLAAVLKSKWPQVSVVVAGKFVARYGRQLMATCEYIDAACLGLPESSIPSLAAHWSDQSAWRQIPGLLLRSTGGLYEAPWATSTVLPASTSPNYHPQAYPALLDGAKFRLFTLGQGWGLSHVAHYRGSIRSHIQTRPVGMLRREIMELHELYGALVFHVAGEHTPGEAVLEFARSCLTLPFSMAYSRDAHVLECDEATVDTLSASGCQALGFTLLTGSQRCLTDYFGENWTISAVEKCLRRCREADIALHTELIHPVPADDFHTRAETIRLLHRCKPGTIRVNIPQLIPGSAWHQHASEFDFSLQPKRLEAWTGSTKAGITAEEEAAQLPFAVGGLSGSATAAHVQQFEGELEGFGPSIDSGCQAALIARVSGYGGREREFSERLERALKTLDIKAMRGFVDTFNVCATASINTIPFITSSATRKVVGD